MAKVKSSRQQKRNSEWMFHVHQSFNKGPNRTVYSLAQAAGFLRRASNKYEGIAVVHRPTGLCIRFPTLKELDFFADKLDIT